MALFEVSIPKRAGREADSTIAKKTKVKAKSPTTVSGGGGIAGLISTIKATVEKYLGKYAESTLLIRDETVLHNYISHCIDNGVISIDTETTGLDPLQDTLVGICIYTPGEKTAYIPINHISYITGVKADNQLSVEFLQKEFQRIVDSKIDVIMFNAPFDIRFIRSGIGVYLTCTWDCYLGARLLNENEGAGNNGLKKLHQKYVRKGVGDAFKFDDLFRGVTFDKIPITTGYLYAAHDAIITYELCEFQKEYLGENAEQYGLQDVAWVFHNIEMPIVDVVANMEDNGIEFDTNYANELSVKYNEQADSIRHDIYKIMSEYQSQIDAYKGISKTAYDYDNWSGQGQTFSDTNPHNPHTVNNASKLDDPINIDSPQQLQILLYDIMKLDAGVDKKTKQPIRGTGEDILKSLNHPLCDAILKYRGVNKLLSTYIDKLPNCVNPKDGRIHCKFNQYGADTGRFSSQDPNLQNIPSHNHDIRKMFKARDGYVLMSSDFSQQEPKALAALCAKQGDRQMLETFLQGKDLYSEIASKAFHKPYDECREFRPDGSTNKEGKERRTQAKSILLGVLYGRGEASIAEQLGCSVDEARAIKQAVFDGFPAIKKFEEDSLKMARELGYVTTVCGRKRRLSDLQLPEFEFKWVDGISPYDDPLDFSEEQSSIGVPENRQNYYLNKLKRCKFNQKRSVFEEANQEGIWIIDNGAKIADATRQCVNARIQGSAADLTKLAMIDLNRSEELDERDFKTLIPVHDEIIAECPKKCAKECAQLLSDTMSKAAEKILGMPIKCDVEITERWYGDTVDLDAV